MLLDRIGKDLLIFDGAMGPSFRRQDSAPEIFQKN